ncbi:MAG: type IV secretion system protein [Alphaproteobacteria bacterium]|nr:type IV secretion system protein [Alphaproteobacteria bacterium]
MAHILGSGNSETKLIGNQGTRRNDYYAASADSELFVGNSNEKKYLWTARAFAIITAVSVCCNIVLIIAIMQVIPLFRVEPFLLTFQNKQEQVYNIKRIRGNMEDHKTVTEVFVRQYILMRSSFTRDIQEMEARWMPNGPIQEMSSVPVYEEFIQRTAKRALEIIRTKALAREVRILSVNEIGRGLWQVEYETRDMFPDSKSPTVNYWTATLRVLYRQKTVKYSERLNNPVGFTVDRYALTHNKVNKD